LGDALNVASIYLLYCAAMSLTLLDRVERRAVFMHEYLPPRL
jgi:hypothetical protein